MTNRHVGSWATSRMTAGAGGAWAVMRRPTNSVRRSVAGVVCAAVLTAACTGSDGVSSTADPVDSSASTAAPVTENTSEPGSPPTSTEQPGELAPPSPPTTLPRGTNIAYVSDPTTGEAMQVEVPARGPATYAAVVDAGVAAGLWSEVDGLRRVLGYVLGVVDAEQLPGVDEIMSVELTEVLQRAHAMSLDDTIPPGDLAELEALYDVMVPGPAVLEAVASGSPIRSGISGLRSPRSASSECAPVNPADFSSWAVIDGCYLVLSAEVAGARLRVFYPAWYRDVPELADYPELAEQSLRKSIETYESLGTVGDIDLIFSIVDTVTTEQAGDGADGARANANHNSLWGEASDSGPCPVTVFPRLTTSEGLILQGIAHEAWHCVQHYSGYPQGVRRGHAWYQEGGADYFSNLVYPTVNYEHRSLELFDETSVETPLFDMSYEAWIWWQWFERAVGSPRLVADFMLGIVADGDGGVSAMNGYGDYLKRFVIDYVAGQIREASGELLPASRYWSGTPKLVGKNDVGKTFDFPVEAMVARRWQLGYDKELRVFESDATEGNGFMAMVPMAERADVSAWKEFFPEVRSKCQNRVDYVVVATTDQSPIDMKVKIDRIEEAPCDPCVLGTWELDLATFQAMLTNAMAREGGAIPPGTTFELSGHYYTSLADGGVMQEQRDGLVITVGAGGQTFDMTIHSFSRGTFTADGERITFTHVIDDYVTVTSSLPGGASNGISQGSSFSEGGSGTYDCRSDDMTVTMDGFDPIRVIRVDKILEPRPIETSG